MSAGWLSTRAPGELQPHEWASLAPAFGRGEFEQLCASVRESGVHEPLAITPDGVVLDGCQRLRAAFELGLEQVPVRIVEPAEPLRFVADSLLQRRHLNAGQKAAVAIEYTLYEQAAREGRQRRLANLRRGSVVPDVAELPARGRSRSLAARLAGVSERTVQDVAAVRDHDPDLYEQLRRGEIAADAAARRVRRQRRDRALPPSGPLPDGLFEVIYADPPWQLGNPDGAFAPENHYPTLPLERIIALNPPSAEDALLYLWAVNSLLEQALQVLNAWGFDYLTNYSWDKLSVGLGVWNRQQHELLLIGRKGNPPPPEPERRAASVIRHKRGRHSQKPAIVYEIIETAHPHAAKLELFARGKPRPGWTSWGNETSQPQTHTAEAA